ncbi:hypothetical protein [Rahnella victoriana]|uniref:Uncharacterized protein n=1 Tax=Rahnella victoriana TaxID=1510570 RepID=A0ABS0DQI2_9GAMM|nr:hypothetical protein [Rahnella victoriana]MBF7956148.1 hypothetical protein [Rahnella victoriana]
MKLLKNEFDYKMWMTYDLLRLDDSLSPLFDHDLLDRELLSQMPREFPCIACIIRGEGPFEPDVAKFLYREEVEEIAKGMGNSVMQNDAATISFVR